MAGKYHLKIANQGFLLKPGSYRRTAVALNSELGTRNSEPLLGWRWWHQSDWRGGDGQRVWDGETGRQGDGGRWRTGYGVEVGEPGRVTLGPSLPLSYLSPEDGFAAMQSFQGRLYALPTSSGKIYTFDGSTWGVDWNSGKSSLASMVRHRERLYAGSGADGVVFVRDGVSWSTAFSIAGAVAITSMASYGVWDAAAKATTPRLFLGCRFANGEAKVYQWDGSTATELHGCQEARAEAMAVYGGRLYVATSDAGDGLQGRILRFDGRSASGEWEEVAWLSDNHVAGWAIFDNLLFCGSGTGGKLWAFDGSRMVEAYSLSNPGLGYPEPLRALAVCAGRLYVGYSHPTQGAALLCKLPAAETGRLGDGETGGRELEGSRYGWFTPSAAGTGSMIRAVASYGGQLYLAGEATGAAPIYRRDATSVRSNGLLETSFFDGGRPGTAKLLRSLTLNHDKLLAGHYLEVRFAMEGSDGFQQLEGFDDLAGCDGALTTADWRPDDSTVRLKGMPAQGFAGKLQGDPDLGPWARKLASPNPNSPPAAFAAEFDDAEYAAVAASGGGVATAINSLTGGYAHQLFEFDLAGLNPAGLRPRAVAYGRGNSFGNPAFGVILRVWNHATGAWDVAGSNSAAPEESVAARTMEETISDFGRYLGPTGRVYLSLRSLYAGSAANPAEVGADLVELGALWAAGGEAVSEPLRLPVAQPIFEATLTLMESFTPVGTQIELSLSADGGEHWEVVDSGVQHVFAHPGPNLRWKARLSTSDGLDTPYVDRLKVDCLIGSWLPLGRSDTEGSTSAAFLFEKGVAARQVAFRIELGSPDPSGGPALAGIALQYALQPETRRQWEMDLLCEGVSGAPLRLLDGSQEGKTGEELSRLLWQASARGIAAFEDLDGSQYQVWFEGLEERLSDAAQERGHQTVAHCRLTEG